MNAKAILGIVGFFLGIPMSYYFQAPLIRKIPLSEYIKLIPRMLTESPSQSGPPELVGNPSAVFIVTCLACAFLFGLAGYFIDQNRNKSA